MLIVISIISIVLIILGIVLNNRSDNGILPPVLVYSGVIILICALSFVAVFSSVLVSGRSVDDKIELCENENEAIYDEMSNIAIAYCDNEPETVDKITKLIKQKASPSTIFAFLPSLRSSELYEKQMVSYNTNRARIHQLQEYKIGLKEYRWWLYFGE